MKTALPIAIVILLSAGAITAQPRVSVPTIDNPPMTYGNCKAMRIHYTARINATGPMDVTYQWVLSDKTRNTPTQVLHFVRSGPLIINYEWNVSGRASGWILLKILSPQQVESQPVPFATNCP
jgi:hypothetical protein